MAFKTERFAMHLLSTALYYGILIHSCRFVSGFIFSDLIHPDHFVTKGDERRLCMDSIPFIQTERDGHHYFEIDHPVLVQRVEFNCLHESELAYETFTLRYIDASDITQLERVYSEISVSQTESVGIVSVSLDLRRLLYTQHAILISTREFTCSALQFYGCETTKICDPDACTNGGSCIGNGQCACASGHYGKRCEIPIDNMPLDDFAFEEIVGASVIRTPNADFDVSGSVTLVPSTQSHRQRTFLLASSCLFHGLGSSLTCSSHHSSGGSSSQGGSNHYPSSQSLSSVFGGFNHGFSHSCSLSFGHPHDHSQTSYLYTTHGQQHHDPGSSLNYCQNSLTMHVNTGQEHHHLTVPFTHSPSQNYNITSSFSPHLGCSIYINGHHQGSQVTPQMGNAGSTSQVQKPLCIGLCGASAGGQSNYTLSNMIATGLSLPGLAVNGLLNVLGNVFSSTLPHLSTTQANVFTLSHTTQSPVTATSHHVPVTQTVDVLCYDCTGQPTDGTCQSLSPCATGKVCSVFHDSAGYTYRCMEKAVCELAQNITSTDCWHCCTSTMCNDRCPVPCTDTPQCDMLKTLTSYNVCGDANLAQTQCKMTCGQC